MKENRFIFNFTGIDKRILKKGKDLKSKNKYSMIQIESLVKWIKVNYGYTVIGLECTDIEDGYKYEFDNIEIKPDEDFNLIEEVTSQINANSHLIKDSGRLVTELNRQYQTETSLIEEQPEIEQEQVSFKLQSKNNNGVRRIEKSSIIDNLFM